MKRALALMLAFVFAFAALTGCKKSSNSPAETQASPAPQTETTAPATNAPETESTAPQTTAPQTDSMMSFSRPPAVCRVPAPAPWMSIGEG